MPSHCTLSPTTIVHLGDCGVRLPKPSLCPDCGRQIKVFGESHIDETAKELGVPVLGRIPMEEKTAKLVDEGAAELVGDKYVKDAVEAIEKL